MTQHKILINGEWCDADAISVFQAYNPSTGEKLTEDYPVSSWSDCDAALDAASNAFKQLQNVPREVLANFIEGYAQLIEDNSEKLVDIASLETGLAKKPRLADVEIPRTVMQLRQAATAVKTASWTMPVIDRQNNIRSMLQSIGPVAVFGPNNFPFAFGSISGGDFAAAIAAGNPIIAKAHPSHPGTTRMFAELAQQAIEQSGMPKGTVQLIYSMSEDSGLKLVADQRIAATAFTGSRKAGLNLKKAADAAGKLIYLELSSINPVVILAGALEERSESIVEEYSNSCIMAAGQLCTKPGLLIVSESKMRDQFVAMLAEQFNRGNVATLLSANSAENISRGAAKLSSLGAKQLTDNSRPTRQGFCHPNTLLSVSGSEFMNNSKGFQLEMFGNASLIVLSDSNAQTRQIIDSLEGNLTGCIYSHSQGQDDEVYVELEPELRTKVGRMINDKMPTGVAVSPAMNHGGPFPSSGHPGFTAVGIPNSIKRFAALKCFDNVRQHRLPDVLKDQCSISGIWRQVDGAWYSGDISEKTE